MPLLPDVVQEGIYHKKVYWSKDGGDLQRISSVNVFLQPHRRVPWPLVVFLLQLADFMPLISLPSHASPFSRIDLINSLWKKTHTIQSLHFLTLSFLHLSYKPLYHPPHAHSQMSSAPKLLHKLSVSTLHRNLSQQFSAFLILLHKHLLH